MADWTKGKQHIVTVRDTKVVDAYIHSTGHWAVFKRTPEIFPGLDPKDARGWSVTHRPTGLRLVITRTMKRAKAVAEAVCRELDAAEMSEGEDELAAGFARRKGLLVAVRAYARGETDAIALAKADAADTVAGRVWRGRSRSSNLRKNRLRPGGGALG